MSRPTCQLANRTFADILKRDVPQCYLCGKKINSIEDLVEPCIDAVFPLLFVATNISGNRHTACWIELNDSFEYFAVPSGTAVSDPKKFVRHLSLKTAHHQTRRSNETHNAYITAR